MEILDGGYAAWQSAHGLTTEGRGLRHEGFVYITYSQLAALGSDEVLLVDLRKPVPAVMMKSPAPG